MRQSVCQGDNGDNVCENDDDDVDNDDCDDGNDNDDGDDHDDELDRDLKETRQMENIEELLDFFLVANDETRRNVTGLMKVHTLSLFILKNYLTMYVILDTI